MAKPIEGNAMTVNVKNRRFAEWLKVARKRANLTQEQLAETLNVSQGAITNWEREGLETMTPAMIGSLARALEVQPVEVAAALGYPTRGAAVMKESLTLADLMERSAELSRRLETQVSLWIVETFPAKDEESEPSSHNGGPVSPSSGNGLRSGSGE